MATLRIPILGVNTIPDESGDVFLEPWSIKATGAPAIDPLVLIFNESGAKDGIRGNFQVPQNYVGTAKFIIIWTANATTGVLNMDLSYLTRSAGEDFGAAATDTTDNATDTKTGTVDVYEELSFTVTSADFAAGDEVLFELFRDSLDAADTMAAPAVVFGVYFEYSDA